MSSTKNKNCYAKIVHLWAWVFLIVGLLFLFFPVPVGAFLTSLAHWIGLSGTITAPSQTLWHVLALSLMAILTVVAFASARQPQTSSLYYALMTAKLTSTIAFLYLALTQGSAWVVGALGDGFVAFTLWWSHRGSLKLPLGLLPSFARTYRGQTPFFEEWFGEVTISPEQALWFRYTILNGKGLVRRSGTRRRMEEASIWAILFRKTVTGHKDTEHLSNLLPGNDPQLTPPGSPERFAKQVPVFQLGSSRLDTGNAVGQAGPVAWDLSFKDSGKRFEHVPKLLRMLKLTRSVFSSCYLDLRFSGKIQDGDETLTVEEAPGLIGHIRGKEHAHEWAWLHCNEFTGDQEVVFEGVSAKLKLGPYLTPPLSSFVLMVGEKTYAFSSVWKLVAERSEFGGKKWVFKSTQGGVTIEGEAELPSLDQAAVVQYTDTDGALLWCHHSKRSTLRLHLSDANTGVQQDFVSKDTAAFEIVNRQRPEGAITL